MKLKLYRILADNSQTWSLEENVQVVLKLKYAASGLIVAIYFNSGGDLWEIKL